MNKSLLFLKYSLLLLSLITLINEIKCMETLDLCGNSSGVDLSYLNHATVWNLTHTKSADESVHFMLSLCKPFGSFDVNSVYKECDNKIICQLSRSKDNTYKAIGYEPTKLIHFGTGKLNSQTVQFDGPVCDQNTNTNYTLTIRFTCGPHLEYPQYFLGSKCRTTLIWRTIAACHEKPIHNEVKCYVYDQNAKRRDLTPLIKPKGDYYKVLSANEEFYINVCSDASLICGKDAGACIRGGSNKLETVGDFRWYQIEYKSQSATVPNDHIELTYNSLSKLCNYDKAVNSTAKTTIRFICPSKHQKRSVDYMYRNPKLVSNLDCNYQIEWLTEFACPLDEIEVEANKCELTESKHGFDFNLKSLLKLNTEQQYYKIENIKLNASSDETLYDIYLNVCGGLGNLKCGGQQWESNAVCIKSNDSKTDKVIGSLKDGKLRFVDNKLMLKYMSTGTDCKFGDNSISESTIIEFVCDDQKGLDSIGRPEFVSFEDCTYSIIWKTSLVCPITTSITPCYTTHKNMTFDLSLLRKGVGSEPWLAGVSQSLPWSRHSKSKEDTIFINVCALLPKTPNTTSCDADSSACMTFGTTNSSVNLGKFESSPKFNEDLNAIELIYDNGFDKKKNKKITTKITLYCKPGHLDSSPVLIDVDEDLGTYEFEWETAAACPIDAVEGNNCRVYDKFLDYTFDLNELKSDSYYPIKTDDYEFQMNVCDSVKSTSCNANSVNTAVGPFGACQVENNGDKRAFSLGKANYSLIYWNGIINMTFTEGTPYRNPEKTPRKSHIAFICDPNIPGKGSPEYDGERNRSYFFRWYTRLACPHTPKIVHCVWDNGSHILDLTPLAYTQGNHFTVQLSDLTKAPAIYYINICRPLNPIHDNSLKDSCGRNSAACKVSLGANGSVLSLGEPNQPPISGFDGSVNLFYDNGSPCPTNPSKRLSTRIKFVCDIDGDLHNPTVIEPGSDEVDGEECVYVFEYKTSAVCNVVEPTKIELSSCVFTDRRTGLSVDLSPLKKPTTSEPYKVIMSQNNSTFELNVCGTANSFASPVCANSAVCFRKSDQIVNYGLLNSSSFYFDGKELKLRYFNGSKCSHSDTGKMSTEIVFKCNPEAKKSSPKLYSFHACVAVFHWETDLVCNIQLPKCSLLNQNNFYNLRQLSSISHAWNTTDNEGNTYFLNVCTKLPPTLPCGGKNAASCKCKTNEVNCSQDLGDPSSHELVLISNGSLLLTYKNGIQNHCGEGTAAQTQITFTCGEQTGNPKFVEFTQSECVYKFEWITFMACPVNDRNDLLLSLNNGNLLDKRINALINIKYLLNKTFFVNEMGRKENYTYVINLSKPQFNQDIKCSNAAICQTKPNEEFKRDIGSIDSIKYYLKGHELQIVLTSFGKQKCGKNKNKNVTSIIRLQCSSAAGLGEPYFVYESNDCDYIFNWETEMVCANNFVDFVDADQNHNKNPANDQSSEHDLNKAESSHGRLWIGFFIVLCVLVTLTALVFYKQRTRQSLMFRFRRLFTPESEHTFHYHQISL